MTDLERRALLGDRQAQDECTQRGIVLPCPWRGNHSHIICKGIFEGDRGPYSSWMVRCEKCGAVKYGSYDWFVFNKETGEFDKSGNSRKESISMWNTRPAPPIGRCEECDLWYEEKGICTAGSDDDLGIYEYTEPDHFCGYFKQKGGEEK